MNVLSIVTTYNRNTCLQRAIRFFLEQDYTGNHTMLIFNSGVETSLPDLQLPSNKDIYLVNKNISDKTNKAFTSVGQKHREAFEAGYDYADFDIVTHSDVDDIFFPNHISEGVKGMQKAYSMNKLGYKPKKSYCRVGNKILLNENVYEPSMFIDVEFILDNKHLDNNVKYHDGWLLPLVQSNKLLVDEEGKPTFCYDWSGQIPVYKMSGRPDDALNFALSQSTEVDTGNGLTEPITKEEADTLYNLILNRVEK